MLLKQGQSVAVSPLPLNGKPYEAFVLDFAEMKTDRVCMWLYLPYVTWQVYPYSAKGHECKCFD